MPKGRVLLVDLGRNRIGYNVFVDALDVTVYRIKPVPKDVEGFLLAPIPVTVDTDLSVAHRSQKLPGLEKVVGPLAPSKDHKPAADIRSGRLRLAGDPDIGLRWRGFYVPLPIKDAVVNDVRIGPNQVIGPAQLALDNWNAVPKHVQRMVNL